MCIDCTLSICYPANSVFINEKVNKMANMNLCNEMQKSALKAAKDGHNILLSGQCGTGKSFTLRYCL